jgi:hypothetical protein
LTPIGPAGKESSLPLARSAAPILAFKHTQMVNPPPGTMISSSLFQKFNKK